MAERLQEPLSVPVLYDRIATIDIDGLGNRDFVGRLARRHQWTRGYAWRALSEYFRFLAIYVSANGRAVPSDPVFRVWCLHATYDRSFDEDLCKRIAGTPVPRRADRDGAVLPRDDREGYDATLRRYEASFGMLPPDIWPARRPEAGRGLAGLAGPVTGRLKLVLSSLYVVFLFLLFVLSLHSGSYREIFLTFLVGVVFPALILFYLLPRRCPQCDRVSRYRDGGLAWRDDDPRRLEYCPNCGHAEWREAPNLVF